MFICRACRSQQRMVFSTLRPRSAQVAQPAVRDAMSDLMRETEQQAARVKRDVSRAPGSSGLTKAKRGPTKETKLESARLAASEKSKKQDMADMELQMPRRWAVGDVYAPHDLSPTEMGKWKIARAKGKQTRDVFDMLNINPVDHYKNFSMMAEYVTETGRIRPASETGLRPRNQRRLGKAIRRAVACGLMPSVYKHPELMRIQIDNAQKGQTFGRQR